MNIFEKHAKVWIVFLFAIILALVVIQAQRDASSPKEDNFVTRIMKKLERKAQPKSEFKLKEDKLLDERAVLDERLEKADETKNSEDYLAAVNAIAENDRKLDELQDERYGGSENEIFDDVFTRHEKLQMLAESHGISFETADRLERQYRVAFEDDYSAEFGEK